LDIIADALQALGGSLSDVVRTRIIVQKEEDCEVVARAHGWAFSCAGVRPTDTLVVSDLIGKQFLVEVEADAELGLGEVFRLSA